MGRTYVRINYRKSELSILCSLLLNLNLKLFNKGSTPSCSLLNIRLSPFEFFNLIEIDEKFFSGLNIFWNLLVFYKLYIYLYDSHIP